MKLYKMITNPSMTMASIDEKPRFASVIAINALGYLFTVMMVWIFLSEGLFKISVIPLDFGNAPELNNYRVMSVLTSFLTFLVVPLVKMFFINIQMPLYKRNKIFTKMLSLGFHALLVLTLGEIIYLVPRILSANVQFAFSVSQVFGKYLSEPLRHLFDYLDFFTIWFQVLIIRGVKMMAGLSTRQSTQIVLLPVILMLALTLFG